VRDGEPEAAADMLGQAIKGRGGSEMMHTQYRKLLALLGRRDEQLKHGREWIDTLLVQDKDKRAVDVVGKDDLAKKLLDQVAERFPGDPLLPDIASYRAFLDTIGAKR
jgi:hypothetical protein